MDIKTQIQNCLKGCNVPDANVNFLVMLFTGSDIPPTAQKILSYYKVSFNLITKKSRNKEIMAPIRAICYFLKEEGFKYAPINRLINRKYPTAKHHRDSYASWLETDKVFREEHEELVKYLNQ